MTTPITATAGRARIDGVYVPALLTFDPGLDCTGWALFAKGLRPHTALIAISRLREHGTMETSPEAPLPLRLAVIQHQMGVVVSQVKADRSALEIAIEVPSKAGEYRRTGKKNAAAMQNLERVIGVLIVTATGIVGHENVRLAPAPSGPWAKKEHRHAWLRSLAEDAQVKLPLGPRGGVPQDVWDAIWNGVQVMRTPRMSEGVG